MEEALGFTLREVDGVKKGEWGRNKGNRESEVGRTEGKAVKEGEAKEGLGCLWVKVGEKKKGGAAVEKLLLLKGDERRKGKRKEARGRRERARN